MKEHLRLGLWNLTSEKIRTSINEIDSGIKDVRFALLENESGRVEVMDVRRLNGVRYVGGVGVKGLPFKLHAAEFNTMGIHRSPRHEQLSYMLLNVLDAEGGLRRPSLKVIGRAASEQIVSYFCAIPNLILGTRSELFGTSGSRSKDMLALFPSDSALAPASVWAIMRVIAMRGEL
jgi:hypothetical protein